MEELFGTDRRTRGLIWIVRFLLNEGKQYKSHLHTFARYYGPKVWVMVRYVQEFEQA